MGSLAKRRKKAVMARMAVKRAMATKSLKVTETAMKVEMSLKSQPNSHTSRPWLPFTIS